MDSSSPDNKGSFPKKAATASVIAPAVAFGIGIILQPLMHGNLIGQVALGSFSILLIVVGFILGAVALICMARYGTGGILWKALIGTVLNGLLFMSILTVSIVSAARGHWHGPFEAVIGMRNYDKDGVQFSYNIEWAIINDGPGSENGNHAARQITLQRRDDGGAICISIYPLDAHLVDMKTLGQKLVDDANGCADPQVEQITGNIGGVIEPGLRLHYSALKQDGIVFTGTGDCYRIQTSKHSILVNALIRKDRGDRPMASAEAVLASIKIDGESGIAAGTGTTSGTTTTSPTNIDAAFTKSAGFFIPAMDRVDMVHDAKRDILYITSGDSVLRYHLDTKTFLTPWMLGGELRGIDISPDDSHIAVADAAGNNGRVRIHLVDLETGNDTPADFTADFQESGTYSVAYGADGQIWISSSMHGSGSLPMRKYNPPTRSAMKLQRVSQDTMLAASADRQCIGFAEAQSSPGAYGRILYRASQLPSHPIQTSGYLYEIAISRDGSQLAAPGYDSMALAGAGKSQLDEREILGAAFHPQRNYLFASQAGTSLISVYDTSNYSKVKDLDFGESFQWSLQAFGSGRLKMSQDGFYLFCTVQGGIRYMATGL